MRRLAFLLVLALGLVLGHPGDALARKGHGKFRRHHHGHVLLLPWWYPGYMPYSTWPPSYHPYSPWYPSYPPYNPGLLPGPPDPSQNLWQLEQRHLGLPLPEEPPRPAPVTPPPPPEAPASILP